MFLENIDLKIYRTCVFASLNLMTLTLDHENERERGLRNPIFSKNRISKARIKTQNQDHHYQHLPSFQPLPFVQALNLPY